VRNTYVSSQLNARGDPSVRPSSFDIQPCTVGMRPVRPLFAVSDAVVMFCNSQPGVLSAGAQGARPATPRECSLTHMFSRPLRLACTATQEGYMPELPEAPLALDGLPGAGARGSRESQETAGDASARAQAEPMSELSTALLALDGMFGVILNALDEAASARRPCSSSPPSTATRPSTGPSCRASLCACPPAPAE